MAKNECVHGRGEAIGEKWKEVGRRWKHREVDTAESEIFSGMQNGMNEGCLKINKNHWIPQAPPPLTLPPVLCWAVINDVVIKQLSGNEGGEGGPRRDIRPARHVSHCMFSPLNGDDKTDTLPVGLFRKFLTFFNYNQHTACNQSADMMMHSTGL